MSLPADIRDYRSLCREIEAAVLPPATSIDGHRFTMQASLAAAR